jgi:hypothetical protein
VQLWTFIDQIKSFLELFINSPTQFACFEMSLLTSLFFNLGRLWFLHALSLTAPVSHLSIETFLHR